LYARYGYTRMCQWQVVCTKMLVCSVLYAQTLVSILDDCVLIDVLKAVHCVLLS